MRRYTPERVTIIRAHHPLLGQEFPVVREGREVLLLELADRSRIRLPRNWTDADGPPETSPGSGPAVVCTVDSLRAVARLVEALAARATSRATGRGCGERAAETSSPEG
jgi:hypothetical protein